MPDLFDTLPPLKTNADAAEAAEAVLIVAADVGQLERRHLGILFEWTPPELRPAVANYVREHRPDLSAEVGAALLELETQPQE